MSDKVNMSDKIPGTDLTADDVVRRMFRVASFNFRRRDMRLRQSFWSYISQLTAIGGDRAPAICRHYGYDPETGEEIGK